MNNDLIKIGIVVITLIGMVGCGGEAPQQKRQQGRLEKMRPKAEDRLSTLMDRSWDNLKYMMYGFMSYDNEKIKTATANLAAISPYMVQRISPQFQEYRVEWREQCNRQQEIAGKLRQQFEEQNFDKARNTLDELIETCMECHKVYRKHLFTVEEEEASP